MKVVQSSQKLLDAWQVHNTIVLPLHSLKEGESLLINQDDKTWLQCEYMARVASCNGLQFVAVRHDNCYEIGRLPMSVNLDLFNNTKKAVKQFDIETCVGKLENEIEKFKTLDFEKIKLTCGSGFSAEMKNQGCIPYTWLQRRLASVNCFKKHEKGATEAIKEAIQFLIDMKKLGKVDRRLLQLEHDTTATVYKIV